MFNSGIDRSQSGVLLVDVQPTFLESAFPENNERREALLVRLEHLLMLVNWMELPLVATFEKPVSENGELPQRLEEVFPPHGQRYIKNYFGCTNQADILAGIRGLSRTQFLVAGAETDVCILQSVLGLLRLGYQVFLLEDCLFTSEPHPGPSLRRMYQAGAVPCTLKSAAYELVECVDQVAWYPPVWINKDQPGGKPFPENFQPPEKWPQWEPQI